MSVYEIKKDNQTEFLVIPYIRGLYQDGQKLIKDFGYAENETGERVSRIPNKAVALEKRYIRNIIRDLTDKRQSRAELIASITRKSIDQDKKDFLVKLAENMKSRDDFVKTTSRKYGVTTANDFDTWTDDVPAARSDILIKQALKQVLVAFRSYETAINCDETEDFDEIFEPHYKAYCDGRAYIREKADVVRDTCTILLRQREPIERQYMSRDNAHFKVYEDRIIAAYDFMKSEFEQRVFSFGRGQVVTTQKVWT